MALNNKRVIIMLTLVAFLLSFTACTQDPPVVTEPSEETTGFVEDTTGFVEDTTVPQETEPAVTEEAPVGTLSTTPELDGTYEQWLAAAMVLTVTTDYPDFVPLGIYTTSRTELSEGSASQGVYLHFLSGGEEIVIHSAPLSAARAEQGAKDLFTSKLGYATFDRVVMNPEELMLLTQLDLNDLAPLMEYSGLVYLYSQ